MSALQGFSERAFYKTPNNAGKMKFFFKDLFSNYKKKSPENYDFVHIY